MNITINAVKFRLAEGLEEFINDKVSKLGRLVPDSLGAEVTLKVDKPSAENNKIADIKLMVRGYDLFASKQGNSFEECISEVIDALKVQIEKHKDKK
ncbi:MAG: HPF/RaiA family ribosome-associated protein [Bacteroidales bacterium]|nr:HPF/RaiA family ribosome-associated protein [Bacteroidales bacterium]MDD4683905.1 HPF/RaiA family ribosome-associated protein [Bacteroidales bacterium]